MPALCLQLASCCAHVDAFDWLLKCDMSRTKLLVPTSHLTAPVAGNYPFSVSSCNFTCSLTSLLKFCRCSLQNRARGQAAITTQLVYSQGSNSFLSSPLIPMLYSLQSIPRKPFTQCKSLLCLETPAAPIPDQGEAKILPKVPPDPHRIPQPLP